MKTKLGLLVLTLVTPMAASAATSTLTKDMIEKINGMGPVDLSVDEAAGQVYVTRVLQNSDAKVDVVDIKTQKSVAQISLGKDITSNQIELAPDGTLYFLQTKKDGSQVLGAYTKGKKQDLSNSIKEIDASVLNVEEDGKVTVEGINKATQAKEITVYSANKSGENVVISKTESISVDEMNSRIAKAAALLDADVALVEPKYGKETGVGITAGFLTGLGFAFRQHFESGWGYHVGLGGYITETDGTFNIAAEVIRMIAQFNKLRFYAVAGASMFYSGFEEYYTEPFDPNDPTHTSPTTVSTANRTRYNFGAGVGIEWAPAGFKSKGVSFSAEFPVGFVAFEDSTSQYDEPGMRFVSAASFIRPSVSVIYYFTR